ncbi:aspartate aminotransferase family protein [Nitratireductor aestuarii]|nr:aminotransferase class III-fold pyridoxal phosphate-dependent enzyme [Nitratireductor aestuarii]
MASGHGATLKDVDGNTYVDLVGEFSAGLYGHSDPVIMQAVRDALEGGVVLAAPTRLEIELASLISARFPSVERLRFCNSGTEANILALMTAIAVTGRKRVLAFKGAYHGGVLTFPPDGNPLNIPLDVTLANYNDVAGTEEMIRQAGKDLAAVIVEPILGAAGNIPATQEFMQMLRRASSECGALLIFDEVKTSRTGRGGMQGQFGVFPDLTTLGKYIGGGLACGAFGGSADIMARFDPGAPGGLKHAGTFNNNVCTMAAGIAGLSQVFTAERADEFLATTDGFRKGLNALCAERGVAMQFSGLGSMFTMHFTGRTITGPADLPSHSRSLSQLFHMFALLRGVLVAGRGDFFISLPTSDAQMQTVRETVDDFIRVYGNLIPVRESQPA